MIRRLPRWAALVAGWLLPPRGRVPKQPDGGSALLRLLAILAVIGIHVNSFFPFSGGDDTVRRLVLLGSACCFWCVPAFVFLSGYHAMDGLETLPARTYWRKRLGRILVPLLFWGLAFTWMPSGSGWLGIRAVAHDWWNCVPAFHLWYIFMLAGLCFLAPLCGRLAKHGPACAAVALFQVAVMAAPLFWSSGVFRHPLLVSIPYAALFTFGCRFAFRGIGRTAGRLAALSCVAYFCCMAFIALRGAERIPYPVFHYLGIGGVWGGISMSVAVLHAGRSFSPAVSARLFRLSKAVFGTYFVHPIVLTAFAKVLPTGFADAVWGRLALLCAAFAASMAIAAQLLKIPFLRRVV